VSMVRNYQVASKKFPNEIAPGAGVSVTFTLTSGPEEFNGDLIGKVAWTGPNNQVKSETTIEKVRNVSPVKINEFAIGDGSQDNPTNSFVELYNAGKSAADISNWTYNYHAAELPSFSSVKIPAGTKLAPHGFYLLGLSNSGLRLLRRRASQSSL